MTTPTEQNILKEKNSFKQSWKRLDYKIMFITLISAILFCFIGVLIQDSFSERFVYGCGLITFVYLYTKEVIVK